MIRWFDNLLRGSLPVEFGSSFGLPESVERLRAATRRSIFSALAREQAVGTVKESRVSLQRVIPMVGNAFKPFFRGRFIERNGKVTLVGRFTMHPLVKVFLTFWFGAAAGIGAILVAAQARQAPLATLLTGVGMIAAPSALAGIGRWFARNDAAWLSEVIRATLSAPAATQPTCTDRPTPRTYLSGAPTMRIVATVLVLMAAMCWLGAIFGTQSVHTGTVPSGVTYVPNIYSRYVDAGLGTMMLIISYGVYQRSVAAWRAGFGLLVGSWLFSVVKVFSPHVSLGVAMIFSVASLVVVIVWIRWWHAQRIHFYNWHNVSLSCG